MLVELNLGVGIRYACHLERNVEGHTQTTKVSNNRVPPPHMAGEAHRDSSHVFHASSWFFVRSLPCAYVLVGYLKPPPRLMFYYAISRQGTHGEAQHSAIEKVKIFPPGLAFKALKPRKVRYMGAHSVACGLG